MNIGIIGAGGMGKAHAGKLAQIEGCRITAVADVNVDAAKSLAEKHGAAAFGDFRDLLKSDVEAVYICTPPYLHEEQAVAAAHARKHVFLEKPIDVSLKAADNIVAACRASGVKLMIGFVLHCYPAFRKIKEVLDSGAIGSPVLLWCSRMGAGPQPSPEHWLQNPAMSGGMAVEFNAHDLDWLRWVGGDAESVYGRVAHAKGMRIEDNVVAVLAYTAGGTGLIASSWSAPIAHTFAGAIGTQGNVVLGNDGQVKSQRRGDAAVTHELEGGVDSLLREDRHFVRCVQDDEEPEMSGEDGVAALELSLAIQESSRSGEVVRLPMDR
ncbi:MAG: Gfo/Idh/MocA family protein [Armatimonadota bacterium]